MIHPESPNACWERCGYRIERNGKSRKIFKPDGSLIFDHGPAGYDAEMDYILKNGLLCLPEVASAAFFTPPVH